MQINKFKFLVHNLIEFLFLFYRRIVSPMLVVLFQSQCRFEESCSCYSQRVFHQYGVKKGLILTIKRILTCSQWSNSNG